MKKLTFLLSLILFTFLSCKKTKTNESGIEGTWTSKTIIADYYNNLNVKIYFEDEPYAATWLFNSDNLTLSVSGVPQNVKSKFTIAQNGTVKTITFASDIGVINQFDISSLSSSTMTWSATNTDPINLIYFENNIPKLASKVVYTINFTKK